MKILDRTVAPLQVDDDGLSILRAVAAGEQEPLIRFSRPEATVAFGRRDELNPGFDEASRAARELGFSSWVRRVGGRAAAYHPGCVIVDHFMAEEDAISGNQQRYRRFGDLYARTLTELGVPSARGELPQEYCPGEFSVHAVLPDGSRTKIVGTAQRVIPGGWWFSAGLVIEHPEPLRQVLTRSYAALNLEMDPSTVGAAAQAEPQLRWEDVVDALQEEFSAR